MRKGWTRPEPVISTPGPPQEKKPHFFVKPGKVGWLPTVSPDFDDVKE